MAPQLAYVAPEDPRPAPTVCMAVPVVVGFDGPGGDVLVRWSCSCGATPVMRKGSQWALARVTDDAEGAFRSGVGCALLLPGLPSRVDPSLDSHRVVRTYLRMDPETNSKKIVKRLLDECWVEVGSKGSHRKFRAPDGRVVIVPHPKKDLPVGTAANIAKTAGWTDT